MKKLPIDLPVKSMTSKVSVGAQEHLRELAKKYDARISDVLSACILHMPEDRLAQVLAEQKKALEGLPKSVKGLLRNADSLTDEERAMLRDVLS